MREVIFRGKTEKGEWVQGCLLYDSEQNEGYIAESFEDRAAYIREIIPETIGQYTGLTDKNGNKIFEGDIVKNDWCFTCGYSVIKFGRYKPLDMSGEYQQGHLGFYLEHIHKADKRSVRKDILYFANNCEIIGNIHDNPELLEGSVENESKT